MKKGFAALALLASYIGACQTDQEIPKEENLGIVKQPVGVGYFNNNTAFLDVKYVELDGVDPNPYRDQAYLDSTLQKLWDRKVRTLVITRAKVTRLGYLREEWGDTPANASSLPAAGFSDLLDKIKVWEDANAKTFEIYAMVQVRAVCKNGTAYTGNHANCTTDNTYANLGDAAVRSTLKNQILTWLHNPAGPPQGSALVINNRRLNGVMMDMEPGGDPGTGDTGISPQNIVNQRQVLADLRAQYGGNALIATATPKYACKKIGTTMTGNVYDGQNCVNGPFSWGLATFWWTAKYADLQIAMVYDTGVTMFSNPNYYQIAKANAYYGSMSVSGEIYRAMWQNDPHDWSVTLPTGRKPQFQIGFAAYDDDPTAPNHYMHAENIANGAQGALDGYSLLPFLCWSGSNQTACNWYTAPYQRTLQYTQGAAVWKHRSGISCERTVPVDTQPCDPPNGVAKWDNDSTDLSTPSNPDWFWWKTYWSGP